MVTFRGGEEAPRPSYKYTHQRSFPASILHHLSQGFQSAQFPTKWPTELWLTCHASSLMDCQPSGRRASMFGPRPTLYTCRSLPIWGRNWSKEADMVSLYIFNLSYLLPSKCYSQGYASCGTCAALFSVYGSTTILRLKAFTSSPHFWNFSNRVPILVYYGWDPSDPSSVHNSLSFVDPAASSLHRQLTRWTLQRRDTFSRSFLKDTGHIPRHARTVK